MKRLAILLCVAACDKSPEPLERVAPPSVALHPAPPVIPPPPPPPPPPPKGLSSDEPGEVPAPVAAFIAAHPDASAIRFDPRTPATGHDLGPARAALLMLILRDPITWGDGQPGCCTEGRTGVRFSDGRASLELEIDGCCHVDIVGTKQTGIVKPGAYQRLMHLLSD